MLRRINQQQIFEKEDKKLINGLRYCNAIRKFNLYAYGFMDNHIFADGITQGLLNRFYL